MYIYIYEYSSIPNKLEKSSCDIDTIKNIKLFQHLRRI